MTLIIGCITKKFGVIAGDTQLSSGDLARGEFDRIIQHKVHQYGPNFMMGILGKWSFIDPMPNGTGTLIDFHKTIQKALLNSKNTDKLGFLNKFLPGKPNIEATAIYVAKDKEYVMDCVTSDGNTKTIKRIDIDGKSLMFNEPFHDTSPDFIEGLIREFCDIHKLSDNLQDAVFLLNNIVLDIIARGKTLNLSVNSVTHTGIPNSVGGYVTMQVLIGDIHHQNCLHRAYNDPKVFLDRTTYPFARSVDHTKKKNYVDNLAMLARGSNDSHNGITEELKEVLSKQIEFAHSQDIIDTDLVNDLVETINGKLNMKLVKFNEEKTSSALLMDFLGVDVTEENHQYYKRFF